MLAANERIDPGLFEWIPSGLIHDLRWPWNDEHEQAAGAMPGLGVGAQTTIAEAMTLLGR